MTLKNWTQAGTAQMALTNTWTERKRSDSKDYVLCDSIDAQFKTRQNWLVALEVRTVGLLGVRMVTRGILLEFLVCILS